MSALRRLDYRVTRQTGDHVRVSTERDGQHHLTIPDHRPLKPGTLAGILRLLEEHHGLTRQQLLRRLFG